MCFLLPVFAYLVEESGRANWPTIGRRPPNYLWWNHSRQARVRQRSHEASGRQRAVRALFLYPLNALIEDQLGVIRKACDSSDCREWLDTNRAGNRFWYGRYVGVTPVSGPDTIIDPISGSPRANSNKRRQLKDRLRQMELEWSRAVRSADIAGNKDILTYFQDPDGSEMWSRWDMHDDPPDILITNYSMLNIMLMRNIETSIFDQTRRWLEQDRKNHLFHLVVDELHTYRGTPGTEVGYLLRALFDRLGLTPDSPQLRIIATSASIEANDPTSEDYLEQFFGRDRCRFTIIPGQRAIFPTGQDPLSARPFVNFYEQLKQDGIQTATEQLIADLDVPVMHSSSPEQLAKALRRVGAFDAVTGVASQEPFTCDQLASSVFSSAPNAQQAAQGLISALVHARENRAGSLVAPLPIRVHYFFHNAGRIWACVNPACSGRTGTTPAGSQPPPVGRLYSEPLPRCNNCNSRVLELLYCQPCGEVFLGGFSKDAGSPNSWFLSPDYPHLERVPDRAISLSRDHGDYLLFWPAQDRPLAHKNHTGPSWRWSQDRMQWFKWQSAVLNHRDGRLSIPRRRVTTPNGNTTGYTFRAPQDEINAFPTKCPHCAVDWSRRLGVSSPIRDLGSGFQRVMQLLCDSLLREMPDLQSRKLVLFSDSRQDAAKLSTGIKLAHYRDTLRQVAFSTLWQTGKRMMQEYAQQQQLHSDAKELLELFRKQNSASLDPADEERQAKLLSTLSSTIIGEVTICNKTGGSLPGTLLPPSPPPPLLSIQFGELLNRVRTELLTLGMNPAGPLPSMARYEADRNIHWTSLVEWTAQPDYSLSIQPRQQQFHSLIEQEFRANVISNVLFASASRDFESLGLGYLWIDSNAPTTTSEQAAATTCRILAQRRRWQGSDSQGSASPPGPVTNYLRATAMRMGIKEDALRRDVEKILGRTLNQWIVVPDDLFVVSQRPRNGMIEIYICGRCGRSHMHGSAGICMECREVLPSSPSRHSVTGTPDDYYEFLARCEQPPFRLNCQELTGQTNRVDRRERQRLFQEVFMDEEVPQASGVDLLSVTTTFEAGVDIGALQAIALANMPPVRFNYQQRIGRAGRRGHGMSAALTLCRGRSHDDYYFERPRLITADPPPRPYVDVTREEIAKRVINKEVLRRAFDSLNVPYSGDNVHGEFGSVAEWFVYQTDVHKWISNHHPEIQDICCTVLRRTAMDDLAGRAQMLAHVTQSLLPEITNVVARPGSLGHHALSERLASNGVLPMFGFPTRVRLLFHGRSPSAQYGWPPERGVVDRQLDIAISQFAPGSQTIKDDELLTSVGVVNFHPQGNEVVEEPDPLGHPVRVGICRCCQALVETPAGAGGCPYCTAPRAREHYREVELSEPPGFLTWYQAEAEYNGAFEFTPRALRARLGRPPRSPKSLSNFEVESDPTQPARIYRVNDRDGNDFEFQKLAGKNIWIVDDAYQQATQALPPSQRPNSGPRYEDPPLTLMRALASISSTDVLAAGIKSIPVGISLNPAVAEGRAAWYSFGFLLRRAAAVRLGCGGV